MPERSTNSRPIHPAGLLIGNAVILCVFLTRFFLVAESAAMGESLWIVALWIAALVLWIVVNWRSAEIAFDAIDLCVGLFAIGHIASALNVLATSGDKRSALNLLWEWVGIGIAWFLLRRQSRRISFQRELIVGIIASGTAVAVLGLYQHYVDFPQTAAKYGPLFDRLRQADAAEAASIRQILARDHIPIDGPSQILFEKRLRDSREPLGLFALANTLGGFLAVCLVLAVSMAALQFGGDDRSGRRRLWGWIPIVAVLGLCLVLTKSRTAWIGTTTGLGAWVLAAGATKLNRIPIRWVAAAVALTALIGWGLIHFGGLDRQVLTEAPKSMQYRLQYWSATWPMINDHPWLGVGLGQFRTNYLFYKLPEASEEISDPHNLFLDSAANGGILAACGLIALCVVLVLKFRGTGAPVDDSTTSSESLLAPYSVSGIGAIAWLILLPSGDDDRLLIVIPLAIALMWGIRHVVKDRAELCRTIQLGSVAASVALLVHLAGAGGIGMPAVTLLLLGLAAIASEQQRWTFRLARAGSVYASAFVIVLGSGLALGLFLTGLRPVWETASHLSTGDQFVERGQPDAADAEYATAAQMDALSYEPWLRRAELAYRKSEADQFRSRDTLVDAVGLMHEASVRDPLNFHEDMRLGDWWLARWQRTNQTADADEAVSAFRRAWIRYPTNARLMANLAYSLVAAGKTHDAADVAKQAAGQDEINHRSGHVDKYLPDSMRSRLNQLAAP